MNTLVTDRVISSGNITLITKANEDFDLLDLTIFLLNVINRVVIGKGSNSPGFVGYRLEMDGKLVAELKRKDIGGKENEKRQNYLSLPRQEKR